MTRRKNKPKRQERLIWRVQYHKHHRAWSYSGFSEEVYFTTQRAAIDRARWKARQAWKHGRLAQVVVHRKDGRIRFENTYGQDPRRYKG